MQGTLSNYDTDLFRPLLEAISRISGHPYRGTMEPATSRRASSPITPGR